MGVVTDFGAEQPADPYRRDRRDQRAGEQRAAQGNEVAPQCAEVGVERDRQRHGRGAQKEVHELGAFEIRLIRGFRHP
jgi:hypothetical protein